MKQLAISLLPMVGVFIIAQVAARWGWFATYRWMSPLFHSLGGMATAWSISVLFRIGEQRFGWRITPRLLRRCCLLCMVAFIGIGWEIYELLLDRYVGTAHLGDVHDTLEDLGMDLIGAAVFLAVFGRFFDSQPST